ncbi:phage major capsid protein [Thermomonospora amylolytica]|uniref:phage major capsid protein n=1 Tax=Thermomonospora amylolytica TaxID=1411117 RepID=UPI0018E5A912|nr:phage major capsid protein [Thermomonospora amylolytica]
MTDEDLRSAPPERLDIPVCRAVPGALELRAEDDGEGDGDGGMPTMTGHFSVFDTWYEIDSIFEGRFLERTAKGAFKKTFRESGDRIRVLLEHGYDPTVGDKPLGVPTRLAEDETGPAYEVPLLDTSYNRDLVPALKAGAYGSSFRFRVMKDEWVQEPGTSEHNPEGLPERTIKEVRVIEFGPTVFPANPDATAGLRSTTDRYYDQLRKRHPEQYDEALRSVRAVRTPAAPARPAEPRTPAAPSTGAAPAAAPARAGAATTKTQEPRKHSQGANATTPKQTVRRSSVDTPMTIEERTARQSEIRARLAEIDSEYSGAALPDEVQTEWDELNDEHEEHERAIRAATERMERLRALSGDTRNVERGTDPGRPHVRRPENIYDLAEIRQQARSLDDLAGLYRDNAMRAIEQMRPAMRGVNREDVQANVERLLNTVDDEQGTLARRILVTGSPTYARAFGKAVKALSDRVLTGEEQRALSIGSDPAGGYAVPFDLDPTVILTSDGSINPLRQVARVEQIVGKEWQGVTSAGITVTRAAEADEAGDNSPTFDQPTVRPTRVQGFVPFSIEIDQDWMALRGEITRLLADAKEEEEAESFVNGNGTGNNPSGIVATLPAGSQVNAGAGFGVDDIYALEEALPPRFRARARWMANRSIYNRARQLDTSGGANLWERLGAGLPPELIGYPAHELSTMPGTIAAGDRYLLFGDFNQFLIVDRIGMSVELVPHLFGPNRRPTGQRGLYAIWRNNTEILVPNAFRVLVGSV